jgi:hypothetical protein
MFILWDTPFKSASLGAALSIFPKPLAVCLFFRRTGSVYQLQKPRKGKRISFLQIFVVTMEFFYTGTGLLFYDVKVGRETVLKAKPKTQEAYCF